MRKADVVIWYQPQDMDWQLDALLEKAGESPAMSVQQSIDAAVDAVFAQFDSAVRSSVVIMSNGGFGGIHQKIVARLQSEASSERLGELKVAAEKVTANEPV